MIINAEIWKNSKFSDHYVIFLSHKIRKAKDCTLRKYGTYCRRPQRYDNGKVRGNENDALKIATIYEAAIVAEVFLLRVTVLFGLLIFTYSI